MMWCEFGRPINNYPNYLVTSKGRVYSQKKDIILKPCYNEKGYLKVSLYKNGKIKVCSIHRLVLETFVGPCPEGMQGRHLNGNKKDNSLENLKWGTSKENRADSIKHGTAFFPKGTQCGTAKLMTSDVLEIRRLYSTGNYLQKELATLCNVTPACINYIVNNKTWKHL